MKREARLLLEKSCDSLVNAIEHFNSPTETGRTTAVLILLDHSFEMLLKAALVQRGARIREPNEPHVIGFNACVRKAVSEGEVRFLSEEQALTIQAINGFRDAAQHHLLDMSEDQLYVQSQAGVTLFRDIMLAVFEEDFASRLPRRVLPLSTVAPTNLEALFDKEVEEIRALLAPGSRRSLEAANKLRTMLILEGAVSGETNQPTDTQISKTAKKLKDGVDWRDLFPGVASIEFTTNGQGVDIALRFTKKEGVPLQVVPEGTPGARVVAVKRVNELDFYNLSLPKIAQRFGMTQPRTLALMRFLGIPGNPDCHREINLGKVRLQRYSQTAIGLIQERMPTIDLAAVWEQYGPELTGAKKARERREAQQILPAEANA